MDRSLFERLVRQGFPVATLEQQRRMRPSISRLIRNTIYPSLQVSAAYLLHPSYPICSLQRKAAPLIPHLFPAAQAYMYSSFAPYYSIMGCIAS